MNNMKDKSSQAKLAIKKDNLEKDLEEAGFHKLDSSVISLKPQKIKWGKLYQAFTDKEKIEYLEKLACTMNHAAYLIQEERNNKLILVDKKDVLIESLKKNLDANNEMIQKQMTKQNEDKQKFNDAYKKLNDINKQLEKELTKCQLSQE